MQRPWLFPQKSESISYSPHHFGSEISVYILTPLGNPPPFFFSIFHFQNAVASLFYFSFPCRGNSFSTACGLTRYPMFGRIEHSFYLSPILPPQNTPVNATKGKVSTKINTSVHFTGHFFFRRSIAVEQTRKNVQPLCGRKKRADLAVSSFSIFLKIRRCPRCGDAAPRRGYC